jgi:gas vesicle protein
MPTDPVYNPQLPSASDWNPPSSAVDSWSGNVSTPRGPISSWSAWSAGLLTGAVAGAAITLMLTPRRGAEVRSSIRHYASDRSERLSRFVDNGRSMAGDAVHRAASLIEQGRNALRSSLGSAGSTWSNSASGGSRTMRSTSQPLTASVAEISGMDRRFEEPLGG